MKRMMFLLLSALFGLGMVCAQTDANAFEGEITSKVFQSQKAKASVKTKNVLAKMILKSVMKKYVEGGPEVFNGSYTAVTLAKGNKNRVNASYNNSVTITVTEGDVITTTTYYPFVKKGWTTKASVSDSKKQMAEMAKGDVEKTGETMTILGHKCEVNRLKYTKTDNQQGTVTTINMNNDYALCDDPSLPGADTETVPGVKGVPLKFVTNMVTQSDNEYLNLDIRLTVSTEVKSITPRAVDDSEFVVPSDIKMIDPSKEPKKYLKMLTENYEYMKKQGLWPDNSVNEDKIFDNLNEEWDF